MLDRYSRRSIQRLVDKVLRLEDPRYFYHQTLTFSPQQFCQKKSKAMLDALLSNLHHQFDMASIHVLHHHRNGAFHFHALFMFFDKAPCSPTRPSDFGTKVFNAWNRVQGFRLKPRANQMKYGEDKLEALRYLLRRVRISKEPTRATRWWTYRNGKLLREKSLAVPLAERKAAFSHVMPRRPYARRKASNALPKSPLTALPDFRSEKVEPQIPVEASITSEWENDFFPDGFGDVFSRAS